ncbi:hypothetical protein MKEN_00403700 [Mycena kentingensis (nom. inval.)]|nr:hypothetical protein MKEN_00403700 [Mycena kentingensis (nom. inval.)]
MLNDLQYAVPEVTVQHKRLDIHLIMTSSDATCVASVDGAPTIRHDAECIRHRFTATWSIQRENGAPAPPLDACECVATDDLDDVEEVADMIVELPPDSDSEDEYQPAQAAQQAPMVPRTTRSNAAQANTVAAAAQDEDLFGPSPPPTPENVQLFRPFVAPEGSDRLRSVFNVDNLFEAISNEALRGARNVPPLTITAQSIEGAGNSLIRKAAECADADDFTNMFTRSRTVSIELAGGGGFSTGDGPLRDAMVAALGFFLGKSEYVTKKAGDRFSITLTAPRNSSIALIGAERQLRLRTFGAIIGLFMASGQAPEQIEYGLLWWLMHNGDRACLTRDFLLEFYAPVLMNVEDMFRAGPSGDIRGNGDIAEHFLTHHELPISSLNARSPALHALHVSDMPIAAIIGLGAETSPEIQCVADGFNLTCRNGFSLRDVIYSHPGGARGFLNQTLLTIIHDADSLLPRVTIHTQRTLGRGAIPDANVLVQEFLRGSGVPSQAALDAAMPDIHRLAREQLCHVDEASFRPRMFCWVATGSTQLVFKNDAERIEVRWVLPGDAYHPTATDIEVVTEAMQAGKCSFRACFKEVYLPVLHLEKLVNATYPSAEGIPTLKCAIESWLLIEILTAIGGHGFI